MRFIQSVFVLLALLFAETVFAAEHEVSVECAWGKLYGTLAIPDGGSDTAILIVAGSGPTDRNGNSGLNLNTYCYKMLSDALVAEGYAVMRYDKRAIGMSHYPSELVCDLVFGDFVDDAVACLNYLRGEGFGHVVVVGHSEGGSIALEMAQRSDVCVDGLVLLCAAGYTMDTILIRQLSAQLMPQYMGLMLRATNIIQTLKRGERVAEQDIPKELISLFHPQVQPFIISAMESDPTELIARVESPVLILSGGRDIQVSVDNAERLLTASQGAKYVNFANMSHVLKDSTTSDRIEQLVSVYTNPQLPITEGLVVEIVEFVKTI